MTVTLKIVITFIIQILSKPVLTNYTRELFRMFRANLSDIEPVHFQIILTFWATLWVFSLNVIFDHYP